MGVEIERKFLLSATPDWLHRCDSARVDQGYLAVAADGAEVRLRRIGERTVLTAKRGRGERRLEEEIELSREQFDALWPLTRGRRLQKVRYHVESGNRLDVDVYHGELEGLTVAEVEFESESASREFEPPDWFGEELTGNFPDEMPIEACELLVGALEADRRRLSDEGDGRAETWRSADQAVAMIEESRAGVDDWGLRGPAWKLIKRGLGRSYRRGRRGFRATVSEPGVETVHEWRKRVKDFWYHLRLIHGCWPTLIGALADEAHELSDLLGDHHDLAVLAEDLRDRRDGLVRGEELEAIVELIERRQDELLEAAVPIGERLYAEKPKQLVRRIHAYWAAWRPD